MLDTLIGALVGGGVTLVATWLSNRNQRELEEDRREEQVERLRRALVTEIQSLGIREIQSPIKYAISLAEQPQAQSSAGMSTPDGRDVGTTSGPATERHIPRLLQSFHTTTLSTSVYQSNADKIGRLPPHQISEVIQFYQMLDNIRSLTDEVVTALEEDDRDKYLEELARLENRVSQLEDRKADALEALNAEEVENESEGEDETEGEITAEE